MRRIAAVALAAAIVVLTLQTPAAAKGGPDSATITGPGIGTTKLPTQSFLDLIRITRFWDGPGVAAWDVDRPAGDLGPRFEVDYHVADLRSKLIHQDLYPFAAEGPVVHMPEGQTILGMDVPYGWLATDRELVRVVKGLGGTPRGEPAPSRIEPAAHEATTSSGEGGPGWAKLAGGAAAAVLLATAVGWRRLRIHRPA